MNKKRLFEMMERINPEFKRDESEEITEKILANPEAIHEIEHDTLKQLKSNQIADIFGYYPELIKHYNFLIENLESNDILNLMGYKPHIIEELHPVYNKIDDYDVYSFLLKNPESVNYLERILEQMETKILISLVKRVPKLKENTTIRKILTKEGYRDLL